MGRFNSPLDHFKGASLWGSSEKRACLTAADHRYEALNKRPSSIESRKILRLQEHKDTLGVLDAPRMINYQRSRYGQNLLKRRLKLPLPRVEPIPFPPIWPPPSRPQPPLLLDEALQRFFLPELSQPDSDFG